MRSAACLSSMVLMMMAVVSGCSAEETQPSPQARPVPEEVSHPSIARGINQFALDLYGTVCADDGSGNIFFSPLSISSALAMTYAGAGGQTALEMNDVLHYGLSPENVGRAFQPFIEALGTGEETGGGSREPFTLSIANGLWVQEGFQLLEDYRRQVALYFDAALENLDFQGDPEGSRRTINDWVADKTMDRILDLIPPGILGPDTRVVLTNAVYFKASWDKPFEEALTSEGRFLVADGSTVEVPMMRQTEFFDYVSTEGCSAVELLYSGGGASMLILLPDGDIDVFQQDLDADVLETIRNRMSRVNLFITMPKFEFAGTMQLGGVLGSMGMETAFGGGADFSGFTGSPDLYISEVMHKAFVKVDESGTEAAAATAVVMNLTAMPEPPVEMNINRPFLFFIFDRETDAIIFMGRVMDPAV
ncbi:MAG: serpin family protein [Candidatus Fermentibacteraceae bacterium]|nr:serpin family protein [Candidatus Fermentibacteraceae bacterium]MBN2607470.1 serpin family protein [Candidatus Fermentibacteraceae bacterium]